MVDLLSVDQAARVLGLGKPTLYRLTSSRRIPHYKVGGKLLFDPHKLQLWLEQYFRPARTGELARGGARR